MATLLTDKSIKDEAPPTKGMKVIRDTAVRGLGIRILPSGTRAFILDYSIAGARRIYTIGKCQDWKLAAARETAKELKRRIRHEGFDPAADLKTAREAPTIKSLCARFGEEHMRVNLAPSTRRSYSRMIEHNVLPTLGNKKVTDVQFEDFAKLHRSITTEGTPYVANACIRMCSKIFNVAVQWRMIDRSPVKGIKKNADQPRESYLSKDQITSVTKALTTYPSQDIADLFRLLLFTGARRGETQSATWDQISLTEGIWTKPSHATKQRRLHRVPLAAPARLLLVNRHTKAASEIGRLELEIAKADPKDRPALIEWRRRLKTYVFASQKGKTGYLTSPSKAWDAIKEAAGIVCKDKKASVRIHDLRHTAATVLASSGASLPLIGKLLGHTQASTTQRYAHLFDDAQKAAVERLGAVIQGGPSAEVIDLKKRRARRSN